MDHAKFLSVVRQFPQVWDRNCATFREQGLKNEAWQRIGHLIGCTAGVAKDTFKSLREKYVRERDKQAMYGNKYIPWQHLEALSFLDPFIILRKPMMSQSSANFEEGPILGDETFGQVAEHYSDFDKTLIAMVKKASPIWDRKSNGYPSKEVKQQLWRQIAHALNKDVNVCMTRWKGLREKYIRQKNKFHEGDCKWELMDNLSFLDSVIQYRKKNCEQDYYSDYGFKYHDSFYQDSSSNDLSSIVKNEELSDEVQDSAYDSASISSSRKRSTSDYSESSVVESKRDRLDESSSSSCPPNFSKTPEAMFGELVAAMLAKKTERDKNVAMIEIMKVLTKE